MTTLMMRGKKLDDVLAVLRLSAAQLQEFTLQSTPLNLLALLLFLGRHADHRACVACLFFEEVSDGNDERKRRQSG